MSSTRPNSAASQNDAAKDKPSQDRGWMSMTISLVAILGILVVGIVTMNSLRESSDVPGKDVRPKESLTPSTERDPKR